MLKTQKTPDLFIQIEESNENSVYHEITEKKPYFGNEIIIRKAEIRDTEDILELLLCEGKLPDSCKLETLIQDLYILTYRERILAVLSGRVKEQKVDVDWAAVHPLYPENSIETAMKAALLGVAARQPL